MAHTFGLNVKNLGGLYYKHYSQVALFIATYSLEIQFIELLFIESTKAKYNIHTIRIDANFFLLSKILPMKTRQWRPLSTAKYK